MRSVYVIQISRKARKRRAALPPRSGSGRSARGLRSRLPPRKEPNAPDTQDGDDQSDRQPGLNQFKVHGVALDEQGGDQSRKNEDNAQDQAHGWLLSGPSDRGAGYRCQTVSATSSGNRAPLRAEFG